MSSEQKIKNQKIKKQKWVLGIPLSWYQRLTLAEKKGALQSPQQNFRICSLKNLKRVFLTVLVQRLGLDMMKDSLDFLTFNLERNTHFTLLQSPQARISSPG